MGIFEKSIPRYTYDPIQKLRVQPGPEYYVDDIFDPILNRNVRTALAQKYGNPLLGTVMGYYEGVENALFGQNDKWGILGPGMGILSGFGRSMDKAGDVILGSLTEGVKGITGQGFENPLENIFVEDQDYTGRRALAAMANSMSRFAGGTTVSEEDFGSAWGLPSLGIELATDPSILGSNLTKIAKAPSVAEQLGSADNFLGDVGKFLQQYDDVMAKASIDLTAPGLRPAIKALRSKLPRIIPTSAASNFVDAHRIINEVNPDVPETIAAGKAAQESLRQDKMANLIADTYDALEGVDLAAVRAAESISDVSVDDLLKMLKQQMPKDSDAARVTDEMALNWAKSIRDAVRIDVDERVALRQAYLREQRELKETYDTSVLSRDVDYARASRRAFKRAEELVKKYSTTVPSEKTLYELYEQAAREYFEIPDDMSFDAWRAFSIDADVATQNPITDVPYRQVTPTFSRQDMPSVEDIMFGSLRQRNAAYLNFIQPLIEEGTLPDYISAVRLRQKYPAAFPEDFDKTIAKWQSEAKHLWESSDVYRAERKRAQKAIDTWFPNHVVGRSAQQNVDKVHVPDSMSVELEFDPKTTAGQHPLTKEDLLYSPEFREHLVNTFFPNIPDLNPELLDGEPIWNRNYIDELDFSPTAWELEAFSKNETLNKQVIETVLGRPTKLGSAPEPFVTISPSDIGKSNPELLALGNAYGERMLEDVFIRNVGEGSFPYFEDKASFEKILKSKDFTEGVKQVVINDSQQEYVLSRIQQLLTRLRFPPENYKGKPYSLYNRFNDFQELRKILNDDSLVDVSRLKSKLYTADAIYDDSSLVLERITHPWRHLGDGTDSLSTYLDRLSKNSDGSFTDLGFVRRDYGYKRRFDDMFEAYTIGNLKNEPVEYADLVKAFEDPDLTPEDFDVFANAVDSFRKQMHETRSSALYLTTPSSVHILKDLRDGLDEYYEDVVKPLRMIESEPYATSKAGGYSLDRNTTPNSDGEATSPVENLGGLDGTAQDTVYAGKSALRGEADFASDTVESTEDAILWNLRNLINSHPEVFEDFDNLTHVYEPLRNYVQFKIRRPIGKHGSKTIARFKTEVLPELERAIADGQFPLRKKTDKYFNEHYPKLQKLLHNDPSSDDFWEIINFSKRNFGNRAKGVPSDVLGLEYYKLAQQYPELVSKWLPKEYVDKVGVDTAIRELFDAVTQTRDPYKFVEGPFGDLLLKSISENRLATYFDKSALDSPELLARLQSRRFMQKLKKFDPVQAHTRFGNAAFGGITYVYRKDLFGRASKAVSEVSESLKSAYRIPKSQTFSAALENTQAALLEETPETVARFAIDPPTAATAAQARAMDDVAEVVDLKQKGVSDDVAEESVPEQIWHWFTKIKEAIAVRINSLGLGTDDAGNRIERATLRTSRNAEIIQRGRYMKIPQATTRDVLKLLTEQSGDVLTGAEFFDEIRRTGIVQASFTDRAAANAAYLRLKHNVDVFNTAVKRSSKDADALTLITRKMSNGNLEIKVMFNTKNKRIAEQIRKNAKALAAAKFDDVTFLKARTLTTEELAFLDSDDARQVVEYLNEVNEMTRDQARMLGFTFNEAAVHNKHVRNVDPVTANYIANDIYNGIDLDSIDEIGVVLSNLDEFRQLDRGVFGAQLQGRRFRGAYWNYDTKDASLFTNDLERIAKGSLGDGMFANSNFQSFVDFFVNDNFKIHGVFEDVDDIRKFLYAGGSEGLYAGNLKNIDLCVPKYDSNGRIIGIHRFDQYSDAALAKALANPDTILVPANTIDTLDKVIRKEIRLSNKAYAFFNKHFTIPFKFGVLTNPGFLVGNLNDAYLKQAVTMSEKYGTDVSTELAKVGEAATVYLNLGNSFNAAIEKWMQHMKECGLEVSGAEAIPEILAGHGPTRRRLMEYLSGNLKGADGHIITPILNNSEKGTIILWTKLQQIQHTSNSLREFDDFAEAFGNSDYDVPRNIVDRVLQGSGKYSRRKPSTWGVITNNPVSRAAMDASEFIENTMRGTAIFNDLMHAGYTKEQIFKILLSKPDPKFPDIAANKLILDVDYANAVNAMYEANFNYERMSDFMEGVGKAMPFPTFFLKNLTYWLTLFEKNPQFFDHAITVHDSMWQGRDTSEDEVLAETKGRGAVPVNVPEGIDKASGQKLSKWFRGMFKPTPLQSMFGAFSLINDPVENLSYRLHPAISGSAQVVNQTLPHSPLTTFLGEAKYRPYSTDIYERNVTQDDEKFNSLAFAAHRANPYERAIGTHLRTPNKMLEGQAQLSDFLPSIFQPDFSKK